MIIRADSPENGSRFESSNPKEYSDNNFVNQLYPALSRQQFLNVYTHDASQSYRSEDLYCICHQKVVFVEIRYQH